MHNACVGSLVDYFAIENQLLEDFPQPALASGLTKNLAVSIAASALTRLSFALENVEELCPHLSMNYIQNIFTIVESHSMSRKQSSEMFGVFHPTMMTVMMIAILIQNGFSNSDSK